MVFPNDSKLYWFRPGHVENFDHLPEKDKIYLNRIRGLLAMNAHQMREFDHVDEPMLRKFLCLVSISLVGRTLRQMSTLMYDTRVIIPCWEQMPNKGFGQYVLSFSLRRWN